MVMVGRCTTGHEASLRRHFGTRLSPPSSDPRAGCSNTLRNVSPPPLVALGSGQRLNEDLTGLAWPEKAERNERLCECASIVRALFEGQAVTHHGRVTVVEAKLYSLPDTPPLLLGAD